MTNFPNRINIENMGGCLAFSFAPSVDIVNIPNDVDCVISSAISFFPNKTWLIGVATYETLQFIETMEKQAAGDIHKIRISGFYPMQDNVALSLFKLMRNYRFVVSVQDGNGRIRIAGTKDQPLMFTFNSDTKTDAKGRAGYAFEFSGITYNPAPFYII